MQIGGKELLVTPGTYQEARALQKAIGRALKGMRIDLPGSVKEDLKAEGLSDIINALLSVAVDDEVENCLFACAARAVIGGEKITTEYFEKLDNRANFYPIMYEIIMVNVGPFFSGIASQFGDIAGKLGVSLKPK